LHVGIGDTFVLRAVQSGKDHCRERDQVEYESPRVMDGAGAGMDPLKDLSQVAWEGLNAGYHVGYPEIEAIKKA
jgi:hypothetical protein